MIAPDDDNGKQAADSSITAHTAANVKVAAMAKVAEAQARASRILAAKGQQRAALQQQQQQQPIVISLADQQAKR